MPFVKLDCGILKSTIWSDSDGRIVFLTALLMATPREYEDAVPQINVRDNSGSGWSAPPGWYGFVAAASTGIAKDACLPIETVRDALERLGAPDHESRSPEYDGRRLIRVNGGYLVLNFQKYRDHDYTGAERARRYRERTGASRRDVTPERRDVTQAEAETEVEADSSSPKKEKVGSKTASSSARKETDDDAAEEGVSVVTEVIRRLCPQMKGLERRNVIGWLADYADKGPWWIAAALMEGNGTMARARSPGYIDRTLRSRLDDEFSCPEAEAFVRHRLKYGVAVSEIAEFQKQRQKPDSEATK